LVKHLTIDLLIPHILGLQALSPENLLSALQANFTRCDTVRV
jgi:hypothetical protein